MRVMRQRSVVCGCVFLAALMSAIASAQDPPAETRPGLAWVFMNSRYLTRPGGTGVDPQIDHNTGTTINDYSRVWAGQIAAPAAGPVTFHAEADNGLRVYIGNQVVIDGWEPSGPREGVVEFPEADAWVPFRLEFFQDGGEGHVRLFWSWEGHARELVPPEAFRYSDNDVTYLRDAFVETKSAEDTPLSYENARMFQPGAVSRPADPLSLKKGPHLFIDDYLVASSENVERVVNVPQRDPAIPNPIITGKEDRCFQPYLTVLRDEASGRFRIWFGANVEDKNAGRSHIGYMESNDGIHWERPVRILDDPAPITFGVSVIDEGPDYPRPDSRFKYGWWSDGGLHVASSPDGFVWTPMSPGVVLLQNHDITGISWDAVRGRYYATASVYRGGDGSWSGNRRVTMQAFSQDLLRWEGLHYVILPDTDIDEGETQFYAMDGYLPRGDMIVGMVKVLRDELKADDPPDPPDAYGVGYTALAWTHDGQTWYRDPVHFFDPHPEKGVWDHAHAWIDDQVLVGDEVYLYYGGYARGHKVNRFEERQIGLLIIKRDRYAGYRAVESGRIVTPPLSLEGKALAINAAAPEGAVRVQVLDEAGTPVPGFTFEDSSPVTGDAVSAPVSWKQALDSLQGRTVRLEFALEKATLYAIELN